MRALHIYLAAYFLIIVAAFVVLWRARVLSELPVVWVAATALVSFGLGILLLLVSRRPPTREPR